MCSRLLVGFALAGIRLATTRQSSSRRRNITWRWRSIYRDDLHHVNAPPRALCPPSTVITIPLI